MNNKTQRRIRKYFFSHYFCFVFFRKNNIRGNAATNNTPNEGKKIIEEKSRKSKGYMIKRLHTQWKQAIYFSCSSGPLKSNELKSQITTVIKQCQEISLEVVATVCDQGSTNQTAINSLLKDTCDMFARMNLENKIFGFLINKKEVVPLYDVPHLFKGVRNNLLSKNLHFELNGQMKIAMWKHTEKFYYLDSADDTRLCPKLTDRHVIKEKINKMKVSYATQVFSHQVGALMLRISQWGK
jgi:hypothetical protein